MNQSSPIPYVLQFKLWSKVKIAGENPDNNFYTNCWEYQGLKNHFGHGRFSHRQQMYQAHRVAYCFAHGLDITTFSADTVVRHKCDNPCCVNPLHLETGSQADNQLDMELRGRNPKGTTHGMSSINIQQVLAIRYLYENAKAVPGTGKAIAERLSISQKVVSDVVTGKTWSSVVSDFSLLDPLPVVLSSEELEPEKRENNHSGSKFTSLDIQRMRALSDCGATLQFIGGKFDGVSEAYVSKIVTGKAWSDVKTAKPYQVLTLEEIAEVKTAKANKGEDHHSAVLTNVQVREMRWLHTQQGDKYGFIARVGLMYGVSKQVARSVVTRTAYTDVIDSFETLEPKPAPVDFGFVKEHGLAALTSTQVREIRWLAEQHQFRGVVVALAARYSTTKENISSIVNRKTWASLADDFESLVKPTPLDVNVKASTNAKLTPLQAREIRYLWETSSKVKGVQTRIADKYEMEVQSIRALIHRKTWDHVPDDFETLDPKPTLAP